MSGTYKIYGDHNTPTQTLLEEFGFGDTARAWFKVYTQRDLGGYNSVTLFDRQGKVLNAAWADLGDTENDMYGDNALEEEFA
jgi:hypothetical protein